VHNGWQVTAIKAADSDNDGTIDAKEFSAAGRSLVRLLKYTAAFLNFSPADVCDYGRQHHISHVEAEPSTRRRRRDEQQSPDLGWAEIGRVIHFATD